MKTRTAFRAWKNTSDFPDAWARPVCEWIAARYGLCGVTLRIRRGVYRSGCGRAWWGSHEASCTIRRRAFRRDWTYATISWAKQYQANTSLESFVFIVAHELHHLSDEAKRLRCDAKARTAHWRQSFEQATDRRAWDTVLAYREEARRFLARYRDSLRRQRMSIKRAVAVQVQRNTPAARLAKLESHLARWERRLIQAQRFVKKYQTKINRSRAAIQSRERRMAATPP